MKKIIVTTTMMLCLATVLPGSGLAQLTDFGDAPEGSLAYPSSGIFGSFPTCITVGSSMWIQHTNFGAWFGPTFDLEPDGNAGLCPSFAPYDLDECWQDGDAGLLIPPAYTIDQTPAVVPCIPGAQGPLGNTCQTAVWGVNIDIDVANFMPNQTMGWVNILMDWNQDGLWGGSSLCPPTGIPAPEHVLVDFPVPNGFAGPLSFLAPSPFLIGPNPGYVWTRFSITEYPVGPGWDGSGFFEDGESEDYLLLVDVEAPEGACCFPDGTCIETTEVDCNNQGGVYQGDGTNCLGDSDGDGVVEPCDNCPNHPNGPSQGTCTKTVGVNLIVSTGQFCTVDGDCDPGEFCEKTQADTYPPGGNGIGDACDCEANFNCDTNVDAIDVADFLADFGRSIFFNPCTNVDPCNGDFLCDVDVDADDVTKFLEDFGRSTFFQPCPICPGGPWCVYP